MTMVASMWFLSILILLIVDTRTGALPHADVESRHCHQCNSTNCDQLHTVQCLPDQPHCVTIATAPNFTTSLSCGSAQESTCILEHKAEQFQLTCTCDDNLCNAPYNQRLRNELLNFSTNFPANSTAKLTETFLKLSTFANVSDEALYEKLTGNTTLTTPIPTTISTPVVVTKLASNKNSSAEILKRNVSVELLPRAEALKHEATVPPDDDEDESEGSGTSVDESKANEHAAPAAPSSYLPANGNSAQTLMFNSFLFLTSLCLHSKL
ncbi:uncharacterized protein LOC123700806 [Colias croceus]|uniref:uncharacterized protein LOC123700806 n=1 Tax=Colias crocea TaxID=72248 RepID=UPI001E27D454|nr:uncharacterized protein LOC123700806 [Colias croceus]